MRWRVVCVGLMALSLSGCAMAAAVPPKPIGQVVRWFGDPYKVTGTLPVRDVGRALGTVTLRGATVQTFHVHMLVRGSVVATGAVALVGRGGRAAAYKAVDLRPDSGIWRIGRHTVQELRLPPDFFRADNRELVLDTSLLTLSPGSPYVIRHRSLMSGRVGRTVLGPCETHPEWGYDDAIPWQEAVLVCAQEKAPSELYLVGDGGTSISASQLPPQPPSAPEVQVSALGFTAGGFQQLLWAVAYSPGPPTPGTGPPPSGILNLQTGSDQPIPAALAATNLYVSPGGQQ